MRSAVPDTVRTRLPVNAAVDAQEDVLFAVDNKH